MRTPLIAAVLAACAIAAAGCGDDDSDNGDGAGGNGNGGGGSGGGLYGGGGGGGEDEAGGEDKAAGEDGGAGGGAAGGATALQLAADAGGDLAFDKTELRAKAGRVSIDFDNPAQVPHAVEVEGMGVEEETEVITGGSAKLTLELEPGEYKFYCPVGNHEQAGMVGTLTVR